jgi:ArsR family transcriptional regulator
MKIVDLLKAIGDDTRIRILKIISLGEHCVCDIEEILDLSQSNASRHLNKLKSLNLINAEKKAPWVYYTLNEETLSEYPFLKSLIDESLNEETFKKDMEKRDVYFVKKHSCES